MTKGNNDALPGSSPSNAAPIGVAVKTRIERGDPYSLPKIYDLDITLLEIIRGKAIWECVKAQKVAEHPNKEGFEYILARIRCVYYRKLRGTIEDETYKITNGQFVAVSADGTVEYKNPVMPQQLQPQIIDHVFTPGESYEGWILLEVPENEKEPLMIFKREHIEGIYGIFGYLWFKLY